MLPGLGSPDNGVGGWSCLAASPQEKHDAGEYFPGVADFIKFAAT
jgi:hypothetical protein